MEKQNNLIRLESYLFSKEKLPRFIAFYIPNSSSLADFDPRIFSPQVMRWGEDIWLCDIKSCQKFWTSRFRQQREAGNKSATNIMEYLEQILQEILQDHDNQGDQEHHEDRKHHGDHVCVLPQHDIFSQIKIAAFNSAWLAVLAVTELKNIELKKSKKRNGFNRYRSINEYNEFGQKFIERCTWESWFACSDILVEGYRKQGKAKLLLQSYKSACHRLLAYAEKQKIGSPHDMRCHSFLSIKRRFGWVISQTWHLSDPRSQTLFPWIPFSPQKPRSVKRIVEYQDYHSSYAEKIFTEQKFIKQKFATTEWEYLVPMLIEDLDKLIASPANKSYPCKSYHGEERVSEIKWSIQLASMEKQECRVSFRFPYPLKKERGHHKTALEQLKLAFYSLPRDNDDFPENNLIIAWSVRLDKVMNFPARALSLFPEINQASDKEERIKNLKNKLPVPAFRCLPPVHPIHYLQEKQTTCSDLEKNMHNGLTLQDGDNSFGIAHKFFTQIQEHRGYDGKSPAGYKRSTECKPFFQYAEPIPISPISIKEDIYRIISFLERQSTNWWDNQSKRRNLELEKQRIVSEPSNKSDCSSTDTVDYYQAQRIDNKIVWIFKDKENQWYEHGIFD